MMAAAADESLEKIDSLNETPQDGAAAKKNHRRASSMAADVYNIEDLGGSPRQYSPAGACA